MGRMGWDRISTQACDRKPVGGERLGELAGLAWQDPKATGEGIWDRIGSVGDSLFHDRGRGIG